MKTCFAEVHISKFLGDTNIFKSKIKGFFTYHKSNTYLSFVQTSYNFLPCMLFFPQMQIFEF